MNKESAIKLMLEKFLEGNRYLGKGSGMPEEEVEAITEETTEAPAAEENNEEKEA